VALRFTDAIRVADFCVCIGRDELIVIIANKGVEISGFEVANKLGLAVEEPLSIGDFFCVFTLVFVQMYIQKLEFMSMLFWRLLMGVCTQIRICDSQRGWGKSTLCSLL
jgi:hypothetical protein